MRVKAFRDWTGQVCDCGHVRAGHEDRLGNKSWECEKEEDCGIGPCFDHHFTGSGCMCKEFGNFDFDLKTLREELRKCK